MATRNVCAGVLAAALLAVTGAARADELGDLKKKAARWESLSGPDRAMILRSAGALRGKAACDFLAELGLKQGDRLSEAKKRFFDENQKRLLSGSADHTPEEDQAAAAVDDEQKVVAAYREAWAAQCEVGDSTEGADHLMDAALSLSGVIAATEKKREALVGIPWDKRWEKHPFDQQYNVLIAGRDAVVRGFSRLAGAEVIAHVEKQGFGKALKSSPEAREMAVEGIGLQKSEAATAFLAARLDDKKEAFTIKVLACGALADQGETAKAAAASSLVKGLDGPEWQLQIAAAEALARLGAREAAGDIIEALKKAPPGRPREVLDDALKKLTGASFMGDEKLWQTWWKNNKESYLNSPPPKPAPSSSGAAQAGDPSRQTGFYGIAVKSKRVTFILDRSGSMLEPAGPKSAQFAITQGPGAGPAEADLKGFKFEKPGEPNKFEIAKIQMIKVLRELPSDASFNIVFFSHAFDLWKPDLQPASAAKKAEAIRFVLDMSAEGSTNIFDPLETALNTGLGGKYGGGSDTVYLLTDGIPNEGRLTDTREINAEVRRMLKTRKCVVHTIGVGESVDEDFLRELARDAGGEYRKF